METFLLFRWDFLCASDTFVQYGIFRWNSNFQMDVWYTSNIWKLWNHDQYICTTGKPNFLANFYGNYCQHLRNGSSLHAETKTFFDDFLFLYIFQKKWYEITFFAFSSKFQIFIRTGLLDVVCLVIKQRTIV